MKILFIAPIPPPINGQSLASIILLNKLKEKNEVKLVNMAKRRRPNNLLDLINRLLEVIKIVAQVQYKKINVDLIYLSLSESFSGNLKDIFIYLICFKYLDKMFIHMLGGAGMKKIIDKHGLQYIINKYFISKMEGVIVEGQTQATNFTHLINENKIHIVPNFAKEYLFVSQEMVRKKFSSVEPLKILFLSNLIFGKGHEELANAYISLDNSIKEKVEIVFVGEFESEYQKKRFLEKIERHSGLIYYGKFIIGAKKKKLYCRSHIFCLPTYYPFEGQPISILEAYATGCVVITTYHSGIPDVFRDKVNGYVVEPKSAESIKEVINNIIRNVDRLYSIALFNREIAFKKYRSIIYCSSLGKILKGKRKVGGYHSIIS